LPDAPATPSKREIVARLASDIQSVRIPRKLDSHSMANWTPVPRQSGQSERSDAGVESVYSWMGSSVNGGWNLRRDSPTRGSGWA
jgi:hypothetical protein